MPYRYEGYSRYSTVRTILSKNCSHFCSVPCVTPHHFQIKAVPYRCEDWSSRERLAILAMCNKLSATIGGCERLVQTPVPLHYVRHTSRFLTIWCLLLPLVIGELVA